MIRKTYNELPEPNINKILVFGSNTQGKHGKGSALLAKEKWGAKYRQARGLQGNSYAIVTKDLTQNIHPSIPVISILWEIDKLYTFAELSPELEFYVAYKGNSSNLNGYTSLQMAKMFGVFTNIPENIIFEENFAELVFNSI